MPAWLMSESLRGEPEARTNLGRPIMKTCDSRMKRQAGQTTGRCRASQSKPALLVNGAGTAKARTYLLHQLIPHVPVSIEPLLAAALGRGRIDRRPVFDVGGDRAGQIQRLRSEERRVGKEGG